MTARISVIIPTFNRAEMVCRCVQSVLDTKWPSLEVIVVDDCSPDNTGEKVKAQFGSGVRYIRNKENSFQAVSRNNGARCATGDFLFFLDDDNIVDKDIFRELTQAFEVFDEIGGFDEKYVQIFEESDFGWKIGEAGYEEIILTSARTEHHGFLEPGCVPELRQLGIEKPYRTYCFARNRLRFAKKHFSFLQMLSVASVFAPLSCGYYGLVAIKNRRPDIAWSYLKGTMAGVCDLFR